jgi:hypothetical protein
MNRTIELHAEEDCYQIDGNSQVIVYKSRGDVLIQTPEFGLMGGLDHKSIRGFSLDEKTGELSVRFLQSGQPNQIDIGTVNDYNQASEWVRAVNEFYKTGD